MALLNILGKETELHSSDYVDGVDLETVVPLTIDPDTSLFSKSIHVVNCTPVGRTSNLSRLNQEYETVQTSKGKFSRNASLKKLLERSASAANHH